MTTTLQTNSRAPYGLSGICDCHTHVFPPQAQFPFSPTRHYTPAEASIEELHALHRSIGVERVVIVHPSPYAADNSCLLWALRTIGESSRGVAVINDQTSQAALTEMHQLEGDDCSFYWLDGTGLWHYESYAYRAALQTVKTWYGARQNNNESDTCFFYQNANYDDGKDRVLNDLLYNYYFMSVIPATPVWTLNNALDIPLVPHGGGSITL